MYTVSRVASRGIFFSPWAPGDDGQVVPLEPQGRDAHQQTEQRRQHPAQQQRQHKEELALGGGAAVGQQHNAGALDVLDKEGGGVGPDGHKPGVAQGDLPQKAGGKVQGGGQDDVDEDGHQDAPEVAGDGAAAHGVEEDGVDQHRRRQVDGVAF